MRIYKFLNEEYGLVALRNRSLKIARICELNDPFEFLAPNLSDPNFRKAFKRLKNQLAKNRGLLCFSKEWTNPLLWSHYADSHQGICLGFDFPDKFLKEVIYISKRPSPDKLKSKILVVREKGMEKLLATKFKHWRYENEVRAFVSLSDMVRRSGHYFFDFSEELRLVEVVVGAEANISRNEIDDALGKQIAGVKRLKARAAFASFNVMINKDEKMWV